MTAKSRIYIKMYHKLGLLFLSVLVLFSSTVTSSDNDSETPGVKSLKNFKISDLFDKSKMEHHYPEIWTEVDYKPIIDNDRLFKKYKECILAEQIQPSGCPRIVAEIKKLIPEMIETMCEKCLPIHIERFKEAISYICNKRRDDFDDVRRIRDPDGAIQARFEAKYGKLEC